MSARRRLSDVIAALRHFPDASGWLRAVAELAWAVPLMLLIAHLGGLIRITPAPDAITSVGLAATLFVAPALGEEVIFRGLIMPREQPGARWIILSAALFVLWHPLQAVTIGPPWSRAFVERRCWPPWRSSASRSRGCTLQPARCGRRSSPIGSWSSPGSCCSAGRSSGAKAPRDRNGDGQGGT